jgi:hypothetical protein
MRNYMIKNNAWLIGLFLFVLILAFACKGPEIIVKDETMVQRQTYEKTLKALWDFKYAIANYEKDNNKYPEKLTNLFAPVQYINQSQADPFSISGRPFGYFHTKKDYVIYSIGPDRTDNKGRMVYLPPSGFKGKGDIILTSHRDLPKLISEK